ncbi:Uncharacterised protein [Streptococcus pneumoniae]|nr:Uncharacterised protein [Streptococcus pneumoniae]
MRTKPCTNTLRFIPKILPTTKQEIYKYKKFDFFINIVAASIEAGFIQLKNTSNDGINNESIAGPPIFFKIGILIPISPKKIPMIIITANPPIISAGNLLYTDAP